MRVDMQVGDGVLFYHSSCVPPGVAGLARVVRTGVVDETQFEVGGKYFDEKSTREKPVWWCVDVEFVEKLPRVVALDELRRAPGLGEMMVLRVPRLSVQPVTEDEYRIVVEMSRREAEPAPPKPKVKKKSKNKTVKKRAKKSARRKR